MTPEDADLAITRVLRGRAAEWVRRYTIEQCALVAERAALIKTDSGKTITKDEMTRRALHIASNIRALKSPSTDGTEQRGSCG